MERADLHVHSCYSDGHDTPEELLRRGEGRLTLLSICDHDTLEAYEHLPESTSIVVLPGIEISTFRGETGIHLLGYFPGGITESLRGRVKVLEDDRRKRVHDGVRRLRDDGIALRWEELREAVGPGLPCRPHVARIMIKMGFARNMQVIFDRYLNGRFAGPSIEVREAIALVREEGGITSWAHPPMGHVELHLESMVADGLQGLEIHTPRRKRGERRSLEILAEKHRLIATGGTDYHGGNNLFGNFALEDERIPEALRLGQDNAKHKQ